MSDPQAELLDARAVVARLGISEVEFRRKCSVGDFPAPDATLKGERKQPKYAWAAETIAPWAAYYEARRAVEAQRRALARAASSTWARNGAGRGARHIAGIAVPA